MTLSLLLLLSSLSLLFLASSTSSPLPPSSLPITKVIVVMMENQSFDHLLGWLPGVGQLKENLFYNENWDGVRIYASNGLNVGTGAIQDRPHDARSVITQMWGTYTANPGPYPTGAFFVKDVFPQSSVQNVDQQQAYMASYAPESSPCLSFLATNFVTCDRWFASVPGSTGPNRLFLHTGGSGGYAGTDWNLHLFGRTIPLLSIFEILDSGMQRDAWKIYEQDELLNTESLCLAKGIEYVTRHYDRVLPFSQYFADIGTDSQAPYTFIVPHLCPESQHPGCSGANITSGDSFLASIYNAFRSSSAWNDTLLVVTYDEHGGYWDSVTPYGIEVTAPQYDGPMDWVPSNNIPFDFKELGSRVPAILVSAYLDPHVDSTIYEHASVPKSLTNLFGTLDGPYHGYLTSRDFYANDFIANQSWRVTPRTDVGLAPS